MPGKVPGPHISSSAERRGGGREGADRRQGRPQAAPADPSDSHQGWVKAFSLVALTPTVGWRVGSPCDAHSALPSTKETGRQP